VRHCTCTGALDAALHPAEFKLGATHVAPANALLQLSCCYHLRLHAPAAAAARVALPALLTEEATRIAGASGLVSISPLIPDDGPIRLTPIYPDGSV
jgi:hypothetical protein